MAEPLLSVRDLVVSFRTDEGEIRAVDGVSFDVADGRTLGVVGESGCGKSVTALSVMRLLPTPPGSFDRGRIFFDGVDVLSLDDRAMRRLRGNSISMVFQEPMSSLNPVYTVGEQIGEALRVHRRLGRKEARAQAIEWMRKVGIPAPEERVDAYPHQLSGGMRQRVVIAMALACRPRLLIADEPTTALDVTVQAQILELLKSLQADLGMSIVIITHDLGVVAEFADEIVVMYAGTVVERGSAKALFASPLHPYTQGLLRSLPGYGENRKRPRLPTIPGQVPDLRSLPTGCRFRNRCPRAIDTCAEIAPPLTRHGDREVACIVVAAELAAASEEARA
jgi:peptide/nickel transport system ATP-binding protein